MQKYCLKLRNLNATLSPYRQQVNMEFQNAVLNGDITSYNIVIFNKDTIEVEIYGEKSGLTGKKWHQKIGFNLKNIHGLQHLCCQSNPHVLFGNWIKI